MLAGVEIDDENGNTGAGDELADDPNTNGAVLVVDEAEEGVDPNTNGELLVNEAEEDPLAAPPNENPVDGVDVVLDVEPGKVGFEEGCQLAPNMLDDVALVELASEFIEETPEELDAVVAVVGGTAPNKEALELKFAVPLDPNTGADDVDTGVLDDDDVAWKPNIEAVLVVGAAV